METYRLSSKLTGSDREIVVQTSNDAAVNAVLSTVFVEGEPADVSRTRHPVEWSAEDVLALVKSRHSAKKDEFETLLRAYREALQSGDAHSLYHLGIAFYYKRLFPEALSLFDSCLTLDERHHGAYNMLSRVFLEMHELDHSIRSARAAVDLKPAYADYRLSLGQALMEAGDYRGAVGEFEESVKINTYYGEAYFCLGLALLLNGINQKDRALFASLLSRSADNLKRAGIIDDEYEGDLFSEGFRLLERQEMDSAYHLFKKVYDARKRMRFQDLSKYYMKFVHQYGDPTPDTIVNRIEYLRDEIRKHPDYADLHIELARLLLMKSSHDWQESLEFFRRALDINPSLTGVDKQMDAVQRQHENIAEVVARVTKGQV